MNVDNHDLADFATMPHFIVVNYQRLLAAPTPQEQVKLSLHTYNLVMRALTIGLVSQYLVRDRDRVSDPYLNKLLQDKFPNVTLDVWNLLLFTTLKAYEGNRDLFFIPELYDFYWDTTAIPHRQRSEVERPFDRLTQMALELLAGRQPRDPGEWERLAEEATQLLRQVLRALAFFGNYDLIHILHADAQFYDFDLHKGPAVVTERQPRPPAVDLIPGSFYLRKGSNDFLPLHPLLVFWAQPPAAGSLSQGDTGVYERFYHEYNHVRYLLGISGETRDEIDATRAHAFVTLLYETISEYKRTRQQAERLTWWQLRDLCREITEQHMKTARGKYHQEWYLARHKTSQAFERFLASEKRGFVLIGKSGVGKTNFLLSVDDQMLQGRNDLSVLMFDGAQVRVSPAITSVISQGFADRLVLEGRQIENIWHEIAQIDGIAGHHIILVVDAINENPQAKELLRQLDELVQGPWPWLKVVFSSRPETWQTIKRGVNLAEAEYYHEAETEALGVELEQFTYVERAFEHSEQLGPFSTQELPQAYQLYQRAFQIATDYAQLPHTLREMLRDPLSLALVARTYAGKAIPGTLKMTELIEKYVGELKRSSRLRDADLRLLEQRLVPLMVREGHYSNAITNTDLDSTEAGADLYSLVYSDQMLGDNERMNQGFNNLVDADILVQQEEGHAHKIAFKYERFYEYFVGKQVLKLSKQHQPNLSEFFADMINHTTRAPFLWGAVKLALIQHAREQGIGTTREFCFTANQRIKELMVHVLTELGRDERSEVERLLIPLIPTVEETGAIRRIRDLFAKTDTALDPQSRNAGEVAVEVACNLKLRDVLQTAARQPDPSIRAAAIRYIYYLWQDDRDLGFEILSFLASKASSGLIPVFTTLESVFGLSLIIFFEHYQDHSVTERLRHIWQGIIDTMLGIRQSSGRIESTVREFVRERVFDVLMAVIFRWLEGFPSNNIVNSHDLQAFFKLGAEEQALYRRLIRYMDAHGEYSGEAAEQDWMAVLRTNNLLMEGVTLMGFVAHAMHHRATFLPFLERFFAAARNDTQPNLYLSVVPLVLTTMLDQNPRDDQAFEMLVESSAACQEYYTKTPQVPGMFYVFQAPESMELAPYIMHQYERTRNVQTEWLESRIQRALAQNNLPFFKTLLDQELHIVGIELQKPIPALSALALFFSTDQPKIREYIQDFLAHLRLHYPDEVDDFLEEQQAPEAFRLQVRTNAPNESIGALIGMRAWVFLRSVVANSDTIRPRIMRIFDRAAACKDLREWVNYFLREVVNMAYGAEVLRQTK
jgi:type II secretory pathway predicted ATPase ExeA